MRPSHYRTPEQQMNRKPKGSVAQKNYLAFVMDFSELTRIALDFGSPFHAAYYDSIRVKIGRDIKKLIEYMAENYCHNFAVFSFPLPETPE